MTSPWGNPPQIPPRPCADDDPTGLRYDRADFDDTTTATAGDGWAINGRSTITVPDLPCGHLPEDLHDAKCAYWRGVASGEYHSPDAYLVDGVFTIPPHLPGLLPLTDPALRGAA